MAETTPDPEEERWRQKGRDAYEDSQPLHAAPSAEPYKAWWLEGWYELHKQAEANAIAETPDILEGIPVRLRKIGDKIYLCNTEGKPLGRQIEIQLAAGDGLTWNAQVTFAGLRLDD